MTYEEFCPADHICLDLGYRARYRVIELLAGDYDQSTIDFVAFDHYGAPKFSKHDRVVLYVLQSGGQLYHHKYSFDLLSPTEDGSYAVCGDPYVNYSEQDVEEYGRDDLTAFTFVPPIQQDIRKSLYPETAVVVLDAKTISELDQDDKPVELDQDTIRENFLETYKNFAPPAYEIEDYIATCKMGMSAQQVANIRMEYKYDPQREYSERRARCRKEAERVPDAAISQDIDTSSFNACMKGERTLNE